MDDLRTPVILVTIKPKSKFARGVIAKHGDTLVLIREHDKAFLVESVHKTFNNNSERYLCWFTKEEATYELWESELQAESKARALAGASSTVADDATQSG